MDTIMEKRLTEANDLREAERFGDSIKAYTECLRDLVDTDDYTGLIHCLGGQSLIYKNLLIIKNSPIYRYFLVAFAKEAYEIGEANKEHLDGRILSIAARVYGDALLANGQVREALPYFEKALAVSTAGIPEKGRLKAQIGGIEYLLGDKQTGLVRINEGLSDVRTGDMTSYTIRVWETGCLNTLAKIAAAEGDREKALGIMDLSLKIATEHNLSLRQKEAVTIIEKIKSGLTDFSL